MNEYMNTADIWKKLWIPVRVHKFQGNHLKSMCEVVKKANGTNDWSREDQYRNGCLMVIENKTIDIPFDIYFATRATPNLYRSDLKPGDKWVCGKTFTNHRWICVPSQKWLQTNPASNIGFSFDVNVLEVQEYKFDKTTKPAIVKVIQEPRSIIHPIKNMNNGNYKLAILKAMFKDRLRQIHVDCDFFNKEQKIAEKEVRYMKKQLAGAQKHLNFMKYKQSTNDYILNQLDK